MNITDHRDEIAPPPNMEMFMGKKHQRASQAALDLHREHAAMQLKAFTKWWDSWLKPRGHEVTDLMEQIQPGVIDIKLIEALSGQKVRKYNQNPTNRFQKGENHLIFLNTVKAKGIKLVNIGPDDLTQANKVLVLGLTWTLILRYEVQRYGAGEMELLKWVEKTTDGYDGVEVTTWNDTFNDGKAFSAVLHKYDPEAIDYDDAKKKKPLECVQNAFDCANASPFHVPYLIEAKDVVEGGDTKSVILYVAKLRQACVELEESRIAEKEAARLAALQEERDKARALTQEKLDSLENIANGLRKWCKDKEKGFKDPVASGELAGGLDLDDLRRRLAEVKLYRTDEKPPRAQEKVALAGLHAALESRLAGAAAADAAAEPGTEDTNTAEFQAKAAAVLEMASPDALTKVWAAMEDAERAYEAALQLRIETREKEVRFKETDDMADPLMKRTDEILKWIADKTAELLAAKKAENLGETAAASAALRAALAKFHEMEKPPKEAEKSEVQDGLRAVALRRTQEEREPLPVPYHAGLVEKAWADLEAAAQLLDDALAERVKQLEKREAEAATDKLSKEADDGAGAWLAKVTAEAEGFKANVDGKKLGSSAAETQALLDKYRADFVNGKKPSWAEEKGKLEEHIRAVDQARADEGREPKAWAVGQPALSAAWNALTTNGNEYEQALLSKLGALKAEEAERLRKAALVDGALSALAELLPPMVARAAKVDAAEAAAVAAAKAAEAELLPWVKEAKERLAAKLEGLSGKTAAGSKRRTNADSGNRAALEAAALSEFEEAEKPPKTKMYFELRAALNDALASVSVQRYAGVGSGLPAAAATLAAIEAEWKALEEMEAQLRIILWKLTVHAQSCASLWERLRRGCNRVGEWVALEHPALTEDRSTASSEGEATTWLAEAQALYAEAAVQKAVVDELAELAAKLTTMQPDYAARAKGAMEGISSVPGMVPVLASKVDRLRAELTRQKRLTQERLTFGAAVAAFQMSVDKAVEVTSFPITSLDTKDVIERLLNVGGQRFEALDKPPEGATPAAIATAEKLKTEWQELMGTLRLRAAEAEQAHKAAVQGAPLHDERVMASSDFSAWFTRCVSILVIVPASAPPIAKDAQIAKADLEQALAVAMAQAAEGEAHTRRLEEVSRQLDSLGAEAEKLSAGEASADSLTEADRTLHTTHVAVLSTQLESQLKAAPSDAPAPVTDVTKALMALADGAGDGGSLTAELLKKHLTAEQAAFVLAHAQVSATSVNVGSWNPFPMDGRQANRRSLPEKLFSLSAHGFAVLEHLNRARTDPKGYAESLKLSLQGAYEGTALTPPWGGPRLQTKEGEAALHDLVNALQSSPVMGPLKFAQGVAEASQELATAFGAGTIKSGADMPLPGRLSKHGKYNGEAAEAIVFGVRQPEAVIAQLLLCDGDKSRQNRALLLSPKLTVGGMGLAENVEHDCVATLTMLQLFATNLEKDTVVANKGPYTPTDFSKVLDAIPSAEVRKMVHEALGEGKKVQLDYKIKSGVEITITAADGTGQKAKMEWK